MKGTLKVLGFVIAIHLLIGGFLALSTANSAEINLRYAGDLPLEHYLTKQQEFFAKRVGEISNGRMKVESFPAGQLFAAKDFTTAVPAGSVDIAQLGAPLWSGLLPATNFFELPLFFDGWPHLWRLLDSAELVDIFQKEFAKAGVRVVYFTQDASLGFATKFPLKKMADWKGKKIRSATELQAQTIKVLGGASAVMGGGEVYMALQRGTVDGAGSSLTSFSDRKYYEVTKYVVEPAMFFPVYVCVMNLKKWNALPPDMQKVLEAAGKDTQEWGRKELQKVEEYSLADLKKHGMEIYYLPKEEREAWRKACKPVYDLVVQKAGAVGTRLFELAEKTRQH